MARTRPRSTRRTSARGGGRQAVVLCGLTVLVLAGAPWCAHAAEAPRSPDKPNTAAAPVIWYADDDQPSPVPAFAEPSLIPYAVDSFVARPFSRFWHPGRFFRRLGTGNAARPASDINTLDEVVNSTWFTNRIGLRPLSAEELALGSALDQPTAEGPDRSAPWTIVGAKTAGVTPGFRIKDARGDTWLLKFDPPNHPGMTIRAGVVSNLIFHAIGFHTPVDRIVEFDRAELVVGAGAEMKMNRDERVPMTEANLDSILAATGSIFEGRYHALASRYLDGIPLGPFDDQGTRPDDPNDRINHENRRELRAMRVFAAWVNHFDTKMHNSLDMYIGDPGQGHVRHYLIDFASTLGAYGDSPVRRFGYEFGFDVWPAMGRLLTLGAVEDRWVGLERPADLAEVGLFDVRTFAPEHWKPDLPHSAMASLTDRDGYWAAKIVTAFTDADLRVIVEQGRYQDPAAVDFLVRTLAGRRDLIGRYWFAVVPPVDHFVISGEAAQFTDLAVQRGYAAAATTTYRYRLSPVEADGQPDTWTEWRTTAEPTVPLLDAAGTPLSDTQAGDAGSGLWACEIQLNRGDGWSRATTFTFNPANGRTLGVSR